MSLLGPAVQHASPSPHQQGGHVELLDRRKDSWTDSWAGIYVLEAARPTRRQEPGMVAR